MGARDLQCLDHAFNTATAFFLLMVLRGSGDRQQVFAEVFRVLRPGGRFLIWDTNISNRHDAAQPSQLALLTI